MTARLDQHDPSDLPPPDPGCVDPVDPGTGAPAPLAVSAGDAGPEMTRRSFVGYVLAAPVLTVAARLGPLDEQAAHAAVGRGDGRPPGVVPSEQQLADVFDVGDVLAAAVASIGNLFVVTINPDGVARFASTRAEVGQGITTVTAQLIAEELDLPIDRVEVSLMDGDLAMTFAQFTGGSTSARVLYLPVRTAAAVARERLKDAAAAMWGVAASTLETRDGTVFARDGRSAPYGSLVDAAAAATSSTVEVSLKVPAQFAIIGRPHRRIDARAAVTGAKVFALDRSVPDALPTMVRRPPTLNGTVVAVRNMGAVQAMPGVTDVARLPFGVAVRARTFGQCIDAVNALDVVWGAGTVDGLSDDDLWRQLRASEKPMPSAWPHVWPFARTVDLRYRFAFRSNAALEPDAAVADVRPDRVDVWSSLKAPFVVQTAIASATGVAIDRVHCHVNDGGGSFGRHLFGDAALEAAKISKAMGKPVRLMWHRADACRHGRTHPMATSRVRATYGRAGVVRFDQRHTSVQTDFTSGFADLLIEAGDNLLPNWAMNPISQVLFAITQNVPYHFGSITQELNEILDTGSFRTGSMRGVYSPDTRTAVEVTVDQVAKAMRSDPLAFRRRYLRDQRLIAVLDRAAAVGGWGRPTPRGVAQGIAVHSEYRSACAVLVEIDCRPETVNRSIARGVGGPRVTKAVVAVDVGLAVNPTGLEAQMQGGVIDGIAQALTSSLHVDKGLPLEASWDNYFYTRAWNAPFAIDVQIMPATSDTPRGAGELAVAPAMAACACAYARATGRVPTTFPINHGTLGFEPYPRSVVPPSPTDGLTHAF